MSRSAAEMDHAGLIAVVTLDESERVERAGELPRSKRERVFSGIDVVGR